MEFGVFDHLDLGAVPLGEHYENRLQLIEAYDRLGLRSYHLAEHHATPLGLAPSPSVFLAAVAQRTRRLRFGPLVYTLSLHHPLRVAEEICMLDQMSGGRLELGVGRGVSPYEVAYFGVDPAKAQAMYVEALSVILRALARQVADFRGRALHLPRRADRARAGAAPASAAVVRPGAARGPAVGGRQPGQHRLQRPAGAGAAGDRRLSPGLGGGGPQRRAICR